MAEDKTLHSVCKWTFHAGKGGFVPADIRPEWDEKNFGTTDFIRLVKERISPRLPDYIELGVELHYDNEYDENNAVRSPVHWLIMAFISQCSHRVRIYILPTAASLR